MRKILVIEDDESIREALQDILHWQGYAYCEAKNGLEGVEVAKNELPDLIVCDILMPQLDGYGVLQALQEYSWQTARIPFIFLTAKSSREDIRYGMSIGADDYIVKPFTAREILQAVERRLEKFDSLYAENARQVEEVKDYVNATLPHELRTPLTGIMGYIGILSSRHTDMTTDEIDRTIQRLQEAASRLQHTVENYLLFAQLALALKDAPQLTGKQQSASCDETQTWITITAQMCAEEHNRLNDLQLDVVERPIAIFCHYLKKLIKEVVDNAFKFSAIGDSVEVVSRVVNGRYHLIITDQGRGMTPEQVRMLEANRQFERQRFEQQGTGLGLAIVQQIVELHGGEFEIISQKKVGTQVHVFLPIAEKMVLFVGDDD